MVLRGQVKIKENKNNINLIAKKNESEKKVLVKKRKGRKFITLK